MNRTKRNVNESMKEKHIEKKMNRKKVIIERKKKDFAETIASQKCRRLSRTKFQILLQYSVSTALCTHRNDLVLEFRAKPELTHCCLLTAYARLCL